MPKDAGMAVFLCLSYEPRAAAAVPAAGGAVLFGRFVVVEILTLPEVLSVLKCSRSTLYVLMKTSAFPSPLKVGRDNRWLASEVEEWLEQRAAVRPATDAVA